MPQDAYTLKYLCTELDDVFKSGKVNRINAPNGDNVILTVYTGNATKKLLLCVNPGCPRIGIIEEEPESPLTASNFCMLLRKHLLSAVVKDISLVGFDRIVKIDFISSGEFSSGEIKTLYIELMGRYSNVILTENGNILGGNRGVNMAFDVTRPLIVGKPYTFPPDNGKKLPWDKTLIESLKQITEDLPKTISNNVQGMALSTAKEIAKEFTEKFGEYNESKSECLYNKINEFLTKESKPCVLEDGGIIIDVFAHPYGTVKGDIKYFENLYTAQEYYFSEREENKEFIRKKERLLNIVNTAYKKAKKKLSFVMSKEKEALNLEENRIKGELILSNIYKIKSGDESLTATNYYDNTEIKIELNSGLTPAQNAEAYYKKYNKQKRTLNAIAPQKESIEKEMEYLLSLIDLIELCEIKEDLYPIFCEMTVEGLLKEQQTRRKKEDVKWCREYVIDGFNVRCGRNNTENEKVTFTAKPNDIWLHVKDYHSTHVVIESNGKSVPEKTIVKAAEICSYYSKCRDSGKAEVVFTEKRFVKKPPKSKAGFVTYTDFKSVIVSPSLHGKEIKA